ncbi:MAG: HAMP domain-containing protein, partial [Defluviitaleaceae bacterium]|nr:HAMP domain-containing protein [Defluviitaleaceae bacterium]
MNTTLGKQILAVFFVPVVVIFIAISVGIYSAVSRYVNERVQLELRSVTEINATELSGQINNVKTAAVSMAQIIEDFDYSAENSREILTRMLQSLFTHEKIYNVRLAFEPQAFDERDGRHRRDYVGAPSGRFMRSFALYGGEIIVADDLDEEFIDDKNFAGWYVTPRDSENIYISVNSERANIIFDRFGEPIYVITVAVPIFREETVIGVVSVDMSVDALNINISNYYHAAQKSTVALFYSGGRIFYSPRANLSDSSVNSLGFSNTSAIWRTFRNRTALLIPEEHCPFSRMSSFILFQPVNIAGYDDGLFMYVSLPRSVYYENLRPAVILILFANAVIFTLLLFILMYAVRKVSRPINQLNRAATAIAQGNIEVAIEYSPNAQNEIGLLSKSLHTMVEKFRLNAMEMEQAQMESTIKSQIVYYITASGDKNTIFKGLASVFCKYFQIHKTTIVYVDSKRDTAFTNDTPPYEFSAHEKIEALLANRKILFLNTQTILSQKIKFLNEKTTSVCLIPLKKEK